MEPQAIDSLRARFNPLIRPYLVVYGGLILAATELKEIRRALEE